MSLCRYSARWLTCAHLALVLVSLAAPVAAAEWRVLATPRFSLLTQAKERDALRWAQDFGQFIEALHEVVPISEQWLPPQTIVMFAREKDFRPFKPAQPDGKPAKIAGFYARRETWSVVGLAANAEDEDLRRVIFHEGVHWFMSASPHRLPLWFDEGIAEVFSTYQVNKGQQLWGEPVPWHVLLLNQRRLIPMSRLIWMGRDDPMFNESDRTSIFYAQSWAFVHFLMFGKREGNPEGLTTYLQTLGKGGHPDEVFREAFGTDYAGIDRQLAAYLRNGTFRRYGKPAKPADLGGAVFRPAPAAFVQEALARLALGSGRFELAQLYADRAVEAAPDSAEAWAVLAAVLVETHAPLTQQREALEQALALGSNDAWCRTALAYVGLEEAQATGGVLPPVARRLANEFEKAINARPVALSPYLGLANIASVLEHATAEDAKFLEQGRLLYPQEPVLSSALAEINHRLGNREQAEAHLAAALEQSGRLTGQQFEHAQTLSARWRHEELQQSVNTAILERRYEDALRDMDEMLRLPRLPPMLRSSLASMRRELTHRSTLDGALAAGNAGRYDEVRHLLRPLVESADTPPLTRREARRLLELADRAGTPRRQRERD